MNVNGSVLLRIIAFICFLAVIWVCKFTDTPDVLDALAIAGGGLAAWVLSTLVSA